MPPHHPVPPGYQGPVIGVPPHEPVPIFQLVLIGATVIQWVKQHVGGAKDGGTGDGGQGGSGGDSGGGSNGGSSGSSGGDTGS